MAVTNATALRYSNLQLLRFLAAFIVVLFHTLPIFLLLGGDKASLVTRFILHGQFGVDIFFVISGFVIAATTLHKPRTLEASLDFAQKRILRIYLGYWPVLVWALVQTWLIAPKHLSELNIPGSIMLTEPNAFKLVLSVAWTLSFELYFYIMFAFSFCLSKTRTILAIYLLFVIVVLRTLVFPFDFPQSWGFFSSGLLLEFFSGVILYVHIDRLRSRWWLLLCLVGFFLPWYFVFDSQPNTDTRAYSYGVSALAIVCFMLLLEKHQLFVSSKSGVTLGDASYTLYLVHTLLLQLFLVLLAEPYLAATSVVVRGLVLAVALLTVVAFSVLGYLFVENPVYRWGLRQVAALPRLIATKILPSRWRHEL